MQYRRVGNSGLSVSAIALGAWLTYGSDRVEQQTAIDSIHAAIDHGINFIDVADAYARGEAEKVVGEAIKGLDRSKLVVSTKAYWPMSDDINDRGLSRKHLIESVNKSLKRFDMDYIDIFFCHRYDDVTPIEETVRAIDDLIHQGKILYWGTSMWTAANINEGVLMAEKLNANRPIVEQPLYNMLDREIVEGELEIAVKQHGMGLVVFSPLAQGVLTGKYNDGIPADSRAAQIDWAKERQVTEERIEKVRQLTTIAGEMGTTMAALALAWTLNNPHVTCAITGASRPSQVEANLKALEVEITDEINDRIENILQNKPELVKHN
ncbi:MAG: aldo/keto reductase [Phototrophicales bacterium]|nr:MAG: aldo/keto reductase [Phototrophicales bacterium]